VWEYICMQSTL